MFAASKTSAAAAGAPAPSTDPQFNYVTMLLHGDGTNGAQNNTFVDSSTNNFTITRNGTPTQGSFSPYGDLWSNQFNGTNSVLNTTETAAFDMGSGNFTVELWAFPTATQTGGIVRNANSGSFAGFAIGWNSSRFRMLFSYNGTAWAFDLGTSSTYPLNTWYHLALVRNGATATLYVNGVSAITANLSTNSLYGGQPLYVGFSRFSSEYFNGYLSNLRVVKGTALYTSAFTPSTTPLTAVSGTSLLTCQSNRFKDNSSNNFAITVTGTPSVQRFSPFDPAAEYSTSVIGGSGYFDGSGDYLSRSFTSTTDPMYFGGNTFTVEAWVYMASTTGVTIIYDCSATNTGSFGATSLFVDTGTVGFQLRPTTGGTNTIVSGGTVVRNTWTHIAFSLNAGSGKLFVNGTQVGSTTTFPTVATFTPVGAAIGRFANGYVTGINDFNGYISNLRLVNNTAVYTTTFTPPTAPLTAITNTSLLLNTVNAGIFDNAMMNDLVTVGNAQVSTAVKKYGTGSMAFDGSGDWLTYPDTPATRLESGDFTIEAWIYLNTVGVSQTIVTKGNITGFIFWVSGNLRFTWGTSSILIASSLSANQWYHVAVVRSGSATGNLKIYIDGVLSATSSTAVTDNFNQTDIGYVGAGRSAANPMNGYIDDLRITKGFARYTANFTPPTAAFPNL
jgi:hypothetical protein